MKKFILCSVLLISTTSIFAQYKKEFGGALGFSNHLGDIGGGADKRHDFIRDLRWQHTRADINGYFRFKLNKDFSLRSNLNYIRLSGSDKNSTNDARVARNLSFKTDVIELSQTFEWNFYQQTKMSPRSTLLTKGKKKRMDFRAYVFAGLGALYFNPKAELNGKTYGLRKLQTEGVAYSPITWTAPVGFGFAYTLNKKLRVGMDFSYRFTGSDFLDDVSGNYAVSYKDAAKSNLAVQNGSTDINDIKNALANRTNEVQSYLPPSAPATGENYTSQGAAYNSSLPYGANFDVVNDKGSKRGGNFNEFTGNSSLKKVNEKDGYFLINITAGYVIKGKNKYYKSKYRNIVNRRKVVKKKTRAKF